MRNPLTELKVILSKRIFVELSLHAHHRNMTLNDFVNMILADFVETELSAIEVEVEDVSE